MKKEIKSKVPSLSAEELSRRAVDTIIAEQQRALKANLENEDVSALAEHIYLYEAYVKFASLLGLIDIK